MTFYQRCICHRYPDERTTTQAKNEILLRRVMDVDIQKIGMIFVAPRRRKMSLTAMKP